MWSRFGRLLRGSRDAVIALVVLAAGSAHVKAQAASTPADSGRLVVLVISEAPSSITVGGRQSAARVAARPVASVLVALQGT